MGPRHCQVCNEAQSKYKCPSCYVPYCCFGITCRQESRETGSDRCPCPASLEASSSEIRKALNDKALQDLIGRIDCSPNAENELDKAMA